MSGRVEVPRFVKGEPGFTAKLNQLGDAVRQLQDAMLKLVGNPDVGDKATGDAFNPSEHDVDEVNDYLATVEDSDELNRVLEAEKAGKARKGILSR
ncbi:hypothetical protein ACRAJ3_11430 [Rhodococcus pyridinivorans]|uniref:hypothetical protein n=1 Tax=Rhodococcus pyridinivorans TaxID=103816 RepID=UPI003D7FA40A